MSIVKNIKKNSNNNLTDIFSLLSNTKTSSGNSPFNISNKNSLRNTLERINSKSKKNNTTKKGKNKSKDSDLIINNYLSQRPRLNTEGNDSNLIKMKFSMDFFKNKIDKIFQINNSNNNTDKRLKSQNNNNDNFRKQKRNENNNNIKSKKSDINLYNLNKKNNTSAHFTRITGNNGNSYNKKIIENTSNNDYNNTNTQNFSHTQSYFNQNNKKNKKNNQIFFGQSEYIRHKNNNKSEDSKKKNIINNKIVKENKIKNISDLFSQMSPINFLPKNKLSHIQNYFINIHKNKKLINNQKSKEKKVLTTEPKDIDNDNDNDKNRIDTDEFFIKDDSNYLVVSKNKTQITNIIEKKENNKYINNYFNICESTNIPNNQKVINKNDGKNNNSDDDIEFDTFEEIHFYFIQKIQKGKKLKNKMNFKKS